ncbi:MAG TPA: class A beta-lactamase-related serine hydrolase, partial [Candidatus Woesebacteria bacterium]|nr:class A beta-lactamase-related serine hydrolase [Candidatus Woesebacteria bacterium]
MIRKTKELSEDEERNPGRISFEEEKEEGEGKRRRIIFVLLLLTTGLSFLIYLGKQASPKIEEITQPVVFRSSPAFSPSPSPVEKSKALELEKILAGRQGVYGVYYLNLETKEAVSIREKESFPAASLIKLPIVYTLYQQAQEGKINLEEKYTLREEDKVGGAGSLYQKEAGAVYSYRELARLCGKQSDNTAAAILEKVLGAEAIEATIRRLGMENTSFSRRQTTPEDIALFWQKLWEGDLKEEYREEILDLLTETIFEEQIPAALPAGVKVAHKVGIDEGILHDAGIIFQDPPFILVLMSKNNNREEAQEA